MGNTQSTGNTKHQLREKLKKLNNVAFDYIIHSNLNKLDQKEHCNDLIILTSDIIDKAFNAQEVEYIYQHTQSGKVIDKKNKELLMYFNKNTMDNFKKYDAASRKQNMCNSIAKYYVKIAHVLEAISSALDYQTSICHKRLNVIKINEDMENKTANINIDFDPVYTPSTKQTLKENIESLDAKPPMHVQENPMMPMPVQEKPMMPMPVQEKPMMPMQNQQGGNDEMITLADEISISNLDRLYNFAEDYNYNGAEKKELSEYGKQLKEQYRKDLLNFFKAYVDNSVTKLPNGINTFKDIEILSLQSKPEKYTRTINNSDNLLGELSNKLKEMQEKILNNELKLMGELQKIVTYEPISRKTKEGKITQKRFIELKSNLNDEILTKNIIPNLRKILTELYTTCQIDYTEILKVFEGIKIKIESQRVNYNINNT
jgi:hypothetical protein